MIVHISFVDEDGDVWPESIDTEKLTSIEGIGLKNAIEKYILDPNDNKLNPDFRPNWIIHSYAEALLNTEEKDYMGPFDAMIIFYPSE